MKKLVFLFQVAVACVLVYVFYKLFAGALSGNED